MSRNKLYKEQKVKLEKAYKNRDYSEAGQNEKQMKKKKILVKHLINNSSSRMVEFNNKSVLIGAKPKIINLINEKKILQ